MMNSVSEMDSDFELEPRSLRKFLSRLQIEPLEAVSASTYPKISVVMPSFNQAAFIERTFLSVLNQNYPNLELIVIDGGSTDGTLDVIEKFRDSITYFHTGADNGQSDALNHGFSKATGDIFAWLNSDDVYVPGAMTAAKQAFEKFPSSTVIFGDWWGIDSEDNVTSENYAFDFNLRHFIYEGFHLNSQAMFWRSGVYRRFGEFDERLHRTMDYDLILRFGLKEGEEKFVRVPQTLACFRRHSAQKTTGAGQKMVQSEHRLIAEKNGLTKKYTLAGKLLRSFYRLRRAWWYIKRGGLSYTWSQLRKYSL